MNVILTSTSDLSSRIVFTWTADLEDCDYLICGFDGQDHAEILDRVLAASGHEGATVAGFTTSIS